MARWLISINGLASMAISAVILLYYMNPLGVEDQ